MIRRAAQVVLLLFLSSLWVAGWLEPVAQRSIPTVTYTLDALERPVEILVDPPVREPFVLSIFSFSRHIPSPPS